MVKVRLETKDGKLVCIGVVPAFQVWPDVLVWGARFFKDTDCHVAGMRVHKEVVAVEMLVVDQATTDAMAKLEQK